MTFTGFEQADFDTFHIMGLEERMVAIQNRIQPKFKEIGEELTDYLSAKLGNEMFMHIAKHARRTVNPPNDTWMAFSSNKRGYKKHPHFQVGLWDDRVFVWLAYIYELPNKKEFANIFIENKVELVKMIPKDYDISTDHMKKSNIQMSEVNLDHMLDRFKNIKSSELLIGKQFQADDPKIKDGETFLNEITSIYKTLIPIYQLSLQEK